MRASRRLAIISIFTAMVIGSNFALASLVDVKLLDAMVFLSAFLFGFRTGASIAILSETIWSFVSPWGQAGVITPFLVGGELLFALAGWAAARAWGREVRFASPYPIFISATLGICATLWDLETNAATALIANTPLLATELQGVPFSISHVASDLLLGAILIPAVAPLILKTVSRRL